MENLLDKIKVGDEVKSDMYGDGIVIKINVDDRYPIKVGFSNGIMSYSKDGYQVINDYNSDKISLIEEQTEVVIETQIDINNLSLSELKNLQKDIEKKISEKENKYVDFTNLQYIN